jgi:integrase
LWSYTDENGAKIMFNSISPDMDIGHFDQTTEKEEMQELNLQHVNRLEIPLALNPQESTFDDVGIWAIYRGRLSKSTVQKRLATAKFMETHPQPVDFRNPTYENWIRHSDYREQLEGATTALYNEWKTMKMFLAAYNIPIWNYRPPLQPKSKAVKLPMPDTVKQMIRHDYSKNRYENKLTQYLLTHTFMLGWRNPSETTQLKTTDVDLETGLILVTETKKRYSTRLIAPFSTIMTGKNTKSMKYWIDNIRPQVETQYSKDALYLKPNGYPFTPEQLRSFLNRHVKVAFPEYRPYVSRHWCATALLIKEYIESKHWNKNRVQNWLGHENESTTNTYIKHAEQYLRLAPYNWFKHVLRRKNSCGGKHAENHKNGKNEVCDSNYSEKRIRFPIGPFWSTGEKLISRLRKIASVNFQLLTKPLRSFFYLLKIGTDKTKDLNFFAYCISLSNNCMVNSSVRSLVSIVPTVGVTG